MSVTSSEPIACVYVIVSHTEPAGVVRLARTIVEQSAAAQVLIHHDVAAGVFPAAALADVARVALVENPVRVHWGTFSQVEAVLRSMRQALRSHPRFDWLTVISGQDYPARPIAAFESMLAGSGADAFLTYDRVTAADRHLNDRYRFAYRRVSGGPLPRLLRARDLYDRVFNRAQPFLRIQTGPRGTFVGRRARPSVMELPIPVYKGWSWITLRRPAVEAVFAALEHRPELLERYAHTLCPDESFFATLVVNTPELTVCNASLHYADWRPGQAGPQFLSIADLAAIRSSKQWFARKIDTLTGSDLRDALDALAHASSLESAR
jgi:hypothetical protein